MEEFPLAAANLELENEEAGLPGRPSLSKYGQTSLVSFIEIVSCCESPPTALALTKTLSELGIGLEFREIPDVPMDQTVTFSF